MWKNLLWVTLILCGLGSSPAWSQPSSAERMQTLVKLVVGRSGASIGVTGSWVTLKNFNDPLTSGTSDFDMTLRVSEGLSTDEAVTQWRKVKDELAAEIRKEFGSKAETILKRTNVYPPEQVLPVSRVKDKKMAAVEFEKLGEVPSLDPFYEKRRTPAGKLDVSRINFIEAADGFYGEGGRKFVQAYEYKAGKTYTRLPESQTVVVGINPGPFSQAWIADVTPQGRSGLITQLNHTTVDLLERGDDRAAIKNLKRSMEESQEFQKHLGLDMGEDSFLRQLDPARSLSAAEKKQLRDKILQLELRNQFMLRQSSAGGKFGQMADTVWRRLDSVMGSSLRTLDKVGSLAQGFFTALEVAQLAGAASRSDYEELLKHSGLMALAGVAASPAFLAEMVDLTMSMSKELGFALIDKNIDVLDFLSGVRRDDVSSDANLQDARELLRRWPREEVFQAFVQQRASQAWPAETQVDQENRRRWLEKSLAFYRSTRQRLEKHFQYLVGQASDQHYHLMAPTASVENAYQVRVQTQQPTVSLPVEVRGVQMAPAEIRRQFEELAYFYPARMAPSQAGSVPKVTYLWHLNGQQVGRTSEPQFTFSDIPPGQHTLEVLVEYFYNPVDSAMAIYLRAPATRGLLVEKEELFAVELKGPETAKVGDTSTYSAAPQGGTPPFRYLWRMDGKSINPTSPNITVDWKVAQGTLLEVEVQDKEQLSATAQKRVEVLPIPLKAQLEGPSKVLITDKTMYTTRWEGGSPPFRFEWYVNGEKAGVGPEQYSVEINWAKLKRASYVLTVRVTDNLGQTFEAQQQVQIENFEITAQGPTQASEGETSQYQLVMRGGLPPYKIQWYLDGEEQAAREEAVKITWPKSGKFGLAVVVTDASGAQDKVVDTIQVGASTAKPAQATSSGSSYTGKISLGSKAEPGYSNVLTLAVAGKSFHGSFEKNPQTYYGIQCYGQFQGTVTDFVEPMSRTVLKDRMRIEGTLTGTCEANYGKETYPLTGKIVGVVFSDGRALGTVDFYAPPFAKADGRAFSRFEWSAQR